MLKSVQDMEWMPLPPAAPDTNRMKFECNSERGSRLKGNVHRLEWSIDGLQEENDAEEATTAARRQQQLPDG